MLSTLVLRVNKSQFARDGFFFHVCHAQNAPRAIDVAPGRFLNARARTRDKSTAAKHAPADDGDRRLVADVRRCPATS